MSPSEAVGTDARGTEVVAADDVATAPGAEAATERPVPLRFARLHLRMGALELARAELEASAGAGELDTEALLDLAEVRWRTGDLSGAGVAANAYLAADRDDVLALVIAAEASAAAGHPGEARQLVSRVLGRTDMDLDAVFAGMPRSWMWPLEPTEEPGSRQRPLPGRRTADGRPPDARARRPTPPGIAASAAGRPGRRGRGGRRRPSPRRPPRRARGRTVPAPPKPPRPTSRPPGAPSRPATRRLPRTAWPTARRAPTCRSRS